MFVLSAVRVWGHVVIAGVPPRCYMLECKIKKKLSKKGGFLQLHAPRLMLFNAANIVFAGCLF